MKAKSSIVNYLKSSYEELTKVTWPTKNQAIKLTIIVFVFSLAFASVLTLVDWLFSLGYAELLSLKS